MAKHPDNGPTFGKATYDHKRPRFDPPSPARIKVEQEQLVRGAAKSRAFDMKAKKFGMGHALFPEKIPPTECIKRRI